MNEYSNDSPNRSGIYRGFFVPCFDIIFAIAHYVTNTVTLASTQTKTKKLEIMTETKVDHFSTCK